MNLSTLSAAMLAALSLGTAAAFAGAGHSRGHGNEPDIGKTGTAGHIDRVIEVTMGEMFFSLEKLRVRRGETVRFIVRNEGDFVHEFNLGTDAMHHAHEEEMMMMLDSGVLEVDRINHGMMEMTDMAHDDPNSVLLEPGAVGEVIWTFSGEAALQLSCNIPGHREGGMLSMVDLVASLN